MPYFRLNYQVDIQGGALDPKVSSKAISRMMEGVNSTLAQAGYDEIRHRLRRVLDNPTGNYESKVTISNASEGYVITNRAVYHNWLEGTDSRNRTTRFRGYATYRLARQEIQQKADKIVAPVIDRFLGELQ